MIHTTSLKPPSASFRINPSNYLSIFFLLRLCLSISAFTSLSSSLAYAVGVNVPGVVTGAGTTLNINNGTLNVPDDIVNNGTLQTSTGVINIGGNWTNNGTFTPGTGSVNFIDGQSPVSILGDNLFYILSAITNAGKQLNLEAGKTQTITQLLTLQGVGMDLLTLMSTVNGQQAMINLQAGGGTVDRLCQC